MDVIISGLHMNGLYPKEAVFSGHLQLKPGSEAQVYAKGIIHEMKTLYDTRWRKNPTIVRPGTLKEFERKVWPGTLKEFERKAQRLQYMADKKSGPAPFGCYFLWTLVQFAGKTKPIEVCVGSGCSKNPTLAVSRVRSLPKVISDKR